MLMPSISSSVRIDTEVSPMVMSNRFDDQINKWSSQVDPDFIKELDFLNITVDEYEKILAENEPKVITSDNTIR